MAGFKHTIKLVLLQTSDLKRDTPVRCYVSFNNKRSIINSGVSIEPRHWNAESQCLRRSATISREKYERITEELKNVVKWIEAVFGYLIEKDQEFPDHEAFKNLCAATIQNKGVIPGQKATGPTHTLFSYIKDLIERTKSGRRTQHKGGIPYGKDAPRVYLTTLNVLKRFGDFKGKKDFLFEDVDLEFYNDFRDYLLDVEKKSDNYFGNCIKNLKLFLNEAAEDGLHNNTKHKSRRFIKVQITPENVYLTTDQLAKLADHDFSEAPRLERVRDLFIVGAWTGLRFSDFTNIKAHNFAGDFIQIQTQKTSERVAIPIHESIRKIMARYKGRTANSLPPAISNVKMNEYIKDVCKEAGMTEPVSLTKAKAGRAITITEPLYKFVSSHTCRRSFASNMYRMGVPTVAIMAVTGHRTEKSFFNYIKLSPTEKAQIMLEVMNRQTMKAV